MAIEKRAFRMAEIATGSREDALDLVQDAMLGLVKSYGDRESADWPPLFYRILQSRIRDWYRRNRVRNRFRVWLGGLHGHDDDERSDAIQNLPDRQPGIERQLAGEDAMAHLQAALQDLPLRQQQAFLLRAWEGMDVSATAFAMGCSEGSVKTHYSRAIHRLREQLEDHWP
ncbi:RNA polymerase sigma-70 factor (ECF subfamily) [Thiogranum longum]|uniref:RNA polymerase sigma-70 factor (ECF subfamily) n=1 Tax=Thiogranum longum TaxID=1537524 RepID=A0A4R1H5K2_9GAMM|nr:RNA polymerase sigma-70 factor (ECF subfamily) [Thiogranum longum]